MVVDSSGELQVLLSGYLCDFLKDVCNWCLRFFCKVKTSYYDGDFFGSNKKLCKIVLGVLVTYTYSRHKQIHFQF